ncbi:hypothetical protein SAMN02910276_01509 [Butyrivibrio sp. Su6]|uniref:hypothetical protein n=1 Tax=Butyrivibrio sp. Su6 TaxID=1520810 RepID=UPI00089EB3FC|nr:hypothetical protein [Butyrivibrio sp. Su6]SEF96235.1 hypothetical protein SAMN02910276_01509 [Butyrivibrio sp. Su6]
MDTFSNIFDILIIFGGAIIIYYAEQMKANDIIKVGIMVPPSVNVKKMKDREGFKAYAFPRHFLQGLILMVLGLVGIGCDLYSRPDLHAIVYIVVLAFYIIGNLFIEKGKKKFY